MRFDAPRPHMTWQRCCQFWIVDTGNGSKGGANVMAGRKTAVVEGGEEAAIAYWKANVRLILSLLGVWALVSYVLGYFLAGPLSGVNLGNVSLSFWIVQQGAIFTFVILIFVYAVLMDRLDQQYDVHE
jgi:putative solute:sodium symporter small subunit